MQAAFLGLVGLAICWTAAARADESEPPAPRRVELILMGDMAVRARAHAIAENALPPLGADVSTHGLDARATGSQMLARLGAQEMSGESGDVLAYGGAEPPERVAPLSAIAVPMWMRPASR